MCAVYDAIKMLSRFGLATGVIFLKRKCTSTAQLMICLFALRLLTPLRTVQTSCFECFRGTNCCNGWMCAVRDLFGHCKYSKYRGSFVWNPIRLSKLANLLGQKVWRLWQGSGICEVRFADPHSLLRHRTHILLDQESHSPSSKWYICPSSCPNRRGYGAKSTACVSSSISSTSHSSLSSSFSFSVRLGYSPIPWNRTN